MAIKKAVREYFAKLGRKGRKARMEKISPQKRRQYARNAANARWAKRDKAE